MNKILYVTHCGTYVSKRARKQAQQPCQQVRRVRNRVILQTEGRKESNFLEKRLITINVGLPQSNNADLKSIQAKLVDIKSALNTADRKIK